ncbi:MAG: hypothetical protein CFH06_01368 [Alphaproteobacteria bacterium MarineAlpha3_Bin5]|nr:hypothetical protein [Magnetovibrio sp.]PPR77260.1 MAG: hypothetical protein CFH06_01368 [Alphaproteobacteria bacterium MarineAlpha3_Bin5]|tara:strand:- start:220 stop:573 length:354 start_codon:yes stop_codon:yes gene_type:complete
MGKLQLSTFFSVFFLILIAADANAIKKRTVKDFQSYCVETNALYPYCNGIVEGLFYILEVNSRSENKFRICLPEEGLTLGQGVRTFLRWAHKNPDYAEKPGIWGIASALIAAWPCDN